MADMTDSFLECDRFGSNADVRCADVSMVESDWLCFTTDM